MLCPVARPNRNDQESTVDRERAGKKVLTETISLQVQVPVGHTATLKTWPQQGKGHVLYILSG